MIYKEAIEKQKLKKYINENGIIIFGDENILNEAFNINSKNKSGRLTIMVRCKFSDNIKHHRTFKLKLSKTDKYGIPIIFNKIDNGEFEWEVDKTSGISKKHIKDNIKKREIDFINAVLKIAGDDMLEYWALNEKTQYRRIDELNRKYDGKDISEL